MKRFMVVYSTPDEESIFEEGAVIKGSSGAAFFDDRGNADQFKMDTECGLGGFAQMYVWKKDHYVFEYE